MLAPGTPPFFVITCGRHDFGLSRDRGEHFTGEIVHMVHWGGPMKAGPLDFGLSPERGLSFVLGSAHLT